MREDTRASLYRDLIAAVDEAHVSHPAVSRCRHPYLQALAGGARRLETPTMVTWNVTKACNLACTYCAANARKGPPGSTPEDRARILDKILSLDPVLVSMIGGEPTLAPEIGDLFAAVVKSGAHADMTTNGARVTESFANALSDLDHSRYSLMISLDSWDRYTNDMGRGLGSFTTATRAARRLASAGVPFAIGMTIGPRNVHQLLGTYRYARDMGASLFCAWFVMATGRATVEDVVLPDEEFARQVMTVLDESSRSTTKISRIDLSFAVMGTLRRSIRKTQVTAAASELASMVGCEGCRYRMLVDENGDVYPCDFLQVDEFLMGNLLTDAWPSIWNSRPALLKAVLSRRTKPGCRDCPMLECDTGCFGVSFAHFKRTGQLLPMCEVVQ